MSHYLKILFSALFVFSTLSLSANAAVENTNAVASTACNATGTMCAGWKIAASRHQRFTTKIYEIGLCTAHPYGAAKTSATFDASTCVVIYTDAAPAAVDLAAAIGTNTALPGTASAPAQGTYGFPYIKLGTDFYSSWFIYKHTSWRVSDYLLQQRCWNPFILLGQQLRKQTH